MTESSLPPPPPPPPRPPVTGPGGHTSYRELHGRPPLVPFPLESRWGLGDAFASYGLFMLASLTIGLMAFFTLDGTRIVGPWLPAVLVIPPLAQLAHIVWVGRARGAGLDRDFGLAFAWRDLAVGAGLWFVSLAGAALAAWLQTLVGVEAPTAAVAELAEESEGGDGITVWIVLLAVGASTVVPVVEELVYRGLWWSALLKRGMDERWVLVVTSAVFAVAHLEPTRSFVLFALGMAIGWGRLRTGWIGSCIVAHAAINTIGMAALLATLD